MKRCWLYFSLFALFFTMVASPAAAIQLETTLAGDCDGFELAVTGKTWVPYTATVMLDLDGSVMEVSFDIIPDALNQVDTVYSGSWAQAPCGVVTLGGSYVLTSGRDIDPVFTGDYPDLTIDCPCLPCDCEGKVATLTLQFIGPEAANIEVMQKKPSETVFSALVASGETFTFTGVDKWGTLSTEIYIYVNGDLNAQIHTSCSQPIGPGLIRGLFMVVSGVDRFGNPLCPVEECTSCKRSAKKEKHEKKNEKHEKKGKGPAGQAGKAALAPAAMSLDQNSPNPFNPVTTISFTLPNEGMVRLAVYNAVGIKVDTLVDGVMGYGQHSVDWNAAGHASGIYFYVMEYGQLRETRRMLYLK